MAFAVGQKVKCIAKDAIPGYPLQADLTVGKIYEVLAYIADGYITIIQDNGKRAVKTVKRFEAIVDAQPAQAIIAAPGVKIKCIEGLRHAGLLRDRVYTIKHVGVNTFYTEELPGLGFAKRRFEIVGNAVAVQRELKVGDVCIVTSHPKSSYSGWIDVYPIGTEVTIKKFSAGDISFKHNDLCWAKYTKTGELGYIPRAALSLKKNVAPRMFKVGDEVLCVSALGNNLGFNGEMRMNIETKKVLTILKQSTTIYTTYWQLSDNYHYTPESLVFADTGLPEGSLGISCTPKPPPPAITLETHIEAMRKEMVKGGGSLNTFAFKNKNDKDPNYHLNAPCYAAAGSDGSGSCGAIEAFVFSLQNAKNYRFSEETMSLIKLWNEYLLFRSPVSDVFIREDYDVMWERGVMVDVSKTISQIVCSAILIREGYEHSAQLSTFKHFIDEGYGENTAFLMCHIVKWNGGEFTQSIFGSRGHTGISGDGSYAGTIKFFQQGFHEDTGNKPANVESGKYQVFNAIAKPGGVSFDEHVANNMKKTVIGEGWQSKTILTNEAVYEYAEHLHKLIN